MTEHEFIPLFSRYAAAKTRWKEGELQQQERYWSRKFRAIPYAIANAEITQAIASSARVGLTEIRRTCLERMRYEPEGSQGALPLSAEEMEQGRLRHRMFFETWKDLLDRNVKPYSEEWEEKFAFILEEGASTEAAEKFRRKCQHKRQEREAAREREIPPTTSATAVTSPEPHEETSAPRSLGPSTTALASDVEEQRVFSAVGDGTDTDVEVPF